MDWPCVLLAFAFLAALGGWLLVSAVQALRTGRANAAGRLVDRAKQPGLFVVTVIVQLAFATTALVLLFTILADRFKPAL